jgi:hypothetical protein
MKIFDVFYNFQILFFEGQFLKYKPPGGLPETRPGFLETQISAKSQGLKTVWSISFNVFCYLSETDNSPALTFRCGFDGNGPGID